MFVNMTTYIRQKNTLNILDAVENNKDYFGNSFLLLLNKRAKKSTLNEMNEIYLLDNPFFDRYAFVGVFQVNLKIWEKNVIPLTQLGLYNAFRDRLTSSDFFYQEKLKDKIKKFRSEHKTCIVETFFDEDYNIIDEKEYDELKEIDRSSSRVRELLHDEDLSNLTIENKKNKITPVDPLINSLDMLKIFAELLSDESVDPKELSQDLKKTISGIENKMEVFKEDENNSYSLETQWCVRVYGALENGISYAKYFENKQKANAFYREILKANSMSKVQSSMICVMP